MMPLLLIPVEAIIDITIVDNLDFQNFQLTLLSAASNYKPFENLSIANSPINLLASYKLNARYQRKTEYFSFLKHPFQRQNVKYTSNRSTMTITLHTAAAAASAAMTASEQQTGVITRTNE